MDLLSVVPYDAIVILAPTHLKLKVILSLQFAKYTVHGSRCQSHLPLANAEKGLANPGDAAWLPHCNVLLASVDPSVLSTGAYNLSHAYLTGQLLALPACQARLPSL